MKKFIGILAVCSLCFAGIAAANPALKVRLITEKPHMSQVKWEAFSNNLVKALASNHKGLQQSAMRLIIQYDKQVNVDRAVFDVIRIYRDSEDECMRRMAVVALGKMENAWANDFLKRSVRFERSPVVRSQIRAVLTAQQGRHVPG